MIKSLLKEKNKLIIDPEKKYKKNEILLELNELAKFIPHEQTGHAIERQVIQFTHISISFPADVFADNFLVLEITQRYFLYQINKVSQFTFPVSALTNGCNEYGQFSRLYRCIHKLQLPI